MTDNVQQTSLPKEKEKDSPNICAWCGSPSTSVIVLEPDRYGYEDRLGKKVRVLRKRAITAKACSTCVKRLKFRDDLPRNPADPKPAA